MLLWNDGAPGAVGNEDVDKPQITAYPADPKSANGASIVICPGGGYRHLGAEVDVAEWFNGIGVAAFVLRYRLGPRYRFPAPLLDVQRAIRTVRANAVKWGLDPNRIGTMGSSAGGHLASCAGTMFDDGRADSSDTIERQSSRPDFLVLAYPVISMGLPYVDLESRIFLLGDFPSPELIEQTSTELHVTAKTPPTFIMQTDADDDVSAENSVMFYLALRKAGVPAEMHIYAVGPHGVGLALNDPTLGNWPERLRLWMGVRGLLRSRA